MKFVFEKFDEIEKDRLEKKTTYDWSSERS